MASSGGIASTLDDEIDELTARVDDLERRYYGEFDAHTEDGHTELSRPAWDIVFSLEVAGRHSQHPVL